MERRRLCADFREYVMTMPAPKRIGCDSYTGVHIIAYVLHAANVERPTFENGTGNIIVNFRNGKVFKVCGAYVSKEITPHDVSCLVRDFDFDRSHMGEFCMGIDPFAHYRMGRSLASASRKHRLGVITNGSGQPKISTVARNSYGPTAAAAVIQRGR